MAAKLTLYALVLLGLCYYASCITMDEICHKHKDAGRCDNGNIKKQCSKVCGGEEPAAPAPPPPPPPPEKNEEEPTTKQPPTTKKSDTTTKKPQAASKSCDKRSPCVSMEDANGAFRKRCEATNGALKPTCYDHCRYDEDVATMKKAFLGGPCPLNQLRTYLTAASNSKDNTACCSDTGVLAAKKTSVCGCFCNPTGPVWPNKGEAGKYAPCVGVLTGIMQCHYYAEGAD